MAVTVPRAANLGLHAHVGKATCPCRRPRFWPITYVGTFVRFLPVPLLLALLPVAAPADAATGPCIPGGGPRCHLWTGKVTFIADGDTINVDIAGDGTPKPKPIPFTGINAMELRRYSKYRARRRGECHGVAATNRLEHFLRAAHRRVRLAAQDPRSRSGHRLRRNVSVRINGTWVDLDREMIAEGYALWLPNGTEWAWNAEYHQLVTQAAAAHLRLWNPAGCGTGPSANAGLTMQLKYDADHNDGQNVNGEWAR